MSNNPTNEHREQQKCVKCGHVKLNPWRGYCQHETSTFGKRPVTYCGCVCVFTTKPQRCDHGELLTRRCEECARILATTSGFCPECEALPSNHARICPPEHRVSRRDAEIREVLEGLSIVMNYANGAVRCWCFSRDGLHSQPCLAARALYAKLQGARHD